MLIIVFYSFYTKKRIFNYLPLPIMDKIEKDSNYKNGAIVAN